jgi:hypothetical protein
MIYIYKTTNTRTHERGSAFIYTQTKTNTHTHTYVHIGTLHHTNIHTRNHTRIHARIHSLIHTNQSRTDLYSLTHLYSRYGILTIAYDVRETTRTEYAKMVQ